MQMHHKRQQYKILEKSRQNNKRVKIKIREKLAKKQQRPDIGARTRKRIATMRTAPFTRRYPFSNSKKRLTQKMN
jgi:hypothetical protein